MPVAKELFVHAHISFSTVVWLFPGVKLEHKI